MPLVKTGKVFAALKLSQKTCLQAYIRFFGLKDDMFLLNTGLVFEQDMVGRRSQSVLFFCFSLLQIPRSREDEIL